MIGVYLHVPFCRQRCDYCAFATYTDRDALMERYVAACRTEIAALGPEGWPPADTVFVGGGTPSRLPADWLAGLVTAIPTAPGAEVTVECNPEDASPARLDIWRDAGVTRVSLGVQSTSAHVLGPGGLGRRHGTGSVGAAVAAVVDAGFDTFNLDLIFGAPVETDADWERSLHDVVGWGAPHVSVYALTVEPGTPLAALPARHPDDDTQARRYLVADRVLAAAGYEWEELSNWALPGHGCRHNRLTWAGGDYRGIGSAAHSHRRGRRFWNVRTPDRYIACMEGGRTAVAGEEVLTSQARAFETLVLSLRTPAGVPDEVLPDAPELAGLVERRGGRAVLTARGRLVANELATRLEVDRYPAEDAHHGVPA
jgi:putative oxygen-independent coproporphyrinogen III oxidase